jgi:TonB family protein
MKIKIAISLVIMLVSGFSSAGAAALTSQQQNEKSVKATRKVDPVYPADAKRAKIEGEVALDVTVEENGEVSTVKVVRGPEQLQQAAVDAAKQWRFSNTVGAPVTIQLSFRFALSTSTNTTVEKKQLKNIRSVAAEYPEEARSKGIQGDVTVEVTIDASGKVIEARATRGHELLRQSALDAAKQFLFENGLGKTAKLTLTFNFVID